MPASVDTAGKITQALSVLQTGAGIDTLIVAFINPMYGAKPGVDGIVGQFDWAVDQVNTWQTNGDIPAWVIPKAAAVAYVSTLATCVSFWAARGIPAPSDPLKPEVERFVEIQSKMFAASIGGN